MIRNIRLPNSNSLEIGEDNPDLFYHLAISLYLNNSDKTILQEILIDLSRADLYHLRIFTNIAKSKSITNELQITLQVHTNEIEKYHMNNISRLIKYLPVRRLSLISNNLGGLEMTDSLECFRYFCNSIQESNYLKILEIKENNLSNKMLNFLINSLKDNPSIIEINLSSNYFSRSTIEYFSLILSTNPIIEKIDLTDTCLDFNSILEILKIRSLKNLILAINPILNNFSEFFCNLSNSRINDLDLSYCQIDYKHLNSIAELICKCRYLMRINLNHNKIKEDCFELILILTKYSYLKEILLKGNPITYDIKLWKILNESSNFEFYDNIIKIDKFCTII